MLLIGERPLGDEFAVPHDTNHEIVLKLEEEANDFELGDYALQGVK
jgi:hypothetical protein